MNNNYALFNDKLNYRRKMYGDLYGEDAIPKSTADYGMAPQVEASGASKAGGFLTKAGAVATAINPIAGLVLGGAGLVSDIVGGVQDRKRADEAERYNRGIASSQWEENRANVVRGIQKEDRQKAWTKSFMRALVSGGK